MPRSHTSMHINERQLKNWKNREKRGGTYELNGASGDTVFVPRSMSDIYPGGARQKNRLRLKGMREVIDHSKGQEKKAGTYIA